MAILKTLSLVSTLFLAASAAPSCQKKARDVTCPEGGLLPEDSSSWLFPVGIYPISKSNPDTNYGTVYSPKITPNDFCTIFNLYVPESAAGKTCTLEFLFPDHSQLQTSDYTFKDVNGQDTTEGHFTFTGYAFGTGANDTTTWNNQPAPGPSPPSPPATLSPGKAFVINAGDCGVQAGQGSLEVSGMLCSTDTTFEYFQDSDKCPIGFYVVIS
ncbi:ubiquitin 3 binding protein But2 C-terminal domain-containing protein [Phyllosticta citribraziliensis]|uniref:Ubiquitin 3 binding protein But2 C-terminal domain-containing protein n=1 Tax=Phyllosticta citribraziliensis TaxID=989973 RepID=A0ABR1M591_9PEZI